jgi:hypothetical protein
VESSNPIYREDPQKMTELFTTTFATHHPAWADVQTLLNIVQPSIADLGQAKPK